MIELIRHTTKSGKQSPFWLVVIDGLESFKVASLDCAKRLMQKFNNSEEHYYDTEHQRCSIFSRISDSRDPLSETGNEIQICEEISAITEYHSIRPGNDGNIAELGIDSKRISKSVFLSSSQITSETILSGQTPLHVEHDGQSITTRNLSVATTISEPSIDRHSNISGSDIGILSRIRLAIDHLKLIANENHENALENHENATEHHRNVCGLRDFVGRYLGKTTVDDSKINGIPEKHPDSRTIENTSRINNNSIERNITLESIIFE